MYRPLPEELTIKKSPIEGLGLYATKNIGFNVFVGLTHILDERFENNYLRTPLGGFYNHSDNPNVQRMVTNVLPKLKFGDTAPNPDDKSEINPYFQQFKSHQFDFVEENNIFDAKNDGDNYF